MRIRLLGTGTPTPSLRRVSSGYLVESGERKILFDFGPGAYHRLLEAGVKPVQVTDVFFTHLHYDHCLDYIRLLMTRWDQGAGRISELNVYGPKHTARMTELLIGEDGVFGPDLAARTELPMSQAVFVARGGTLPRAKPRPVVRELKSGDTVEGPGFRVKAHSVIHAQPVLECFGYRLEAEGRSFAYSGDAGPCKAMEDLARDADVMVHMCHFISGTALNAEFERRNGGHLEVARLAQAAGVRNLVASHITEQMDVPGVRERLIREMAEIFRGNLFFGEDLMEIPVGAPGPRKLD
ncbi:MAG TPA: MBL fold metallo-hydrolase [Burkholderiales bacterium]|nr:MBL fold metallo-hydrolase [Burkholderiales bacterium]